MFGINNSTYYVHTLTHVYSIHLVLRPPVRTTFKKLLCENASTAWDDAFKMATSIKLTNNTTNNGRKDYKQRRGKEWERHRLLEKKLHTSIHLYSAHCDAISKSIVLIDLQRNYGGLLIGKTKQLYIVKCFRINKCTFFKQIKFNYNDDANNSLFVEWKSIIRIKGCTKEEINCAGGFCGLLTNADEVEEM